MQTFLPCDTFSASASVLDMKRLGKQRVETKQILLALSNPDYGWQNHPIVKMWRGYERALALYGINICDEWIRRGYKDTCREFFLEHLPEDGGSQIELPWWWLDEYTKEQITSSHRSNLLRKDAIHYGQFGWKEPSTLDYYWAITNDITNQTTHTYG